MMAFLALSAVYSDAFGLGIFQKQFISQYPSAKETAIDDCSTCHTPAIQGFLNAYAIDLVAEGFDFTAVEAIDSDKDGQNNLEEINNLTNPGSQMSPDGVMVYKQIFFPVRFNHNKHIKFPDYKQLGVNENICSACHIKVRHGAKKAFDRIAFDAPQKKDVDFHSACRGCHMDLNKASGNTLNLPTDCNSCHIP